MKSYLPGTWYAVFGDTVTVLLPAAEQARVGAVWTLVDSHAPFEQVLDQLLAHGLSTLSGFALLGEEHGNTRVLARGNVRATLTTPQGPVLRDGTGATTWTDVTAAEVTGLVLEMDSEVLGEQELPIATGLVRV